MNDAASGAAPHDQPRSRQTPVRCVALDFGGVLDKRADSGAAPGAGHVHRVDGSLPVAPAAVEAIWGLHRLGLKVLVASNTRPGQSREAQLVAAGVRELLLAVLHSDRLDAAKPSPAFFAAVIAASGCAPAEICYVGNRLHTDVQPAVAAGLQAVLVASSTPPSNRGGEVPDGVAVITHVRQLPGLLAQAIRKDAQ